MWTYFIKSENWIHKLQSVWQNKVTSFSLLLMIVDGIDFLWWIKQNRLGAKYLMVCLFAWHNYKNNIFRMRSLWKQFLNCYYYQCPCVSALMVVAKRENILNNLNLYRLEAMLTVAQMMNSIFHSDCIYSNIWKFVIVLLKILIKTFLTYFI